MRRLVANLVIASTLALAACSTEGELPKVTASTAINQVFERQMPGSSANMSVTAGDSETAKIIAYLKWITAAYTAAAQYQFAPLTPKIETLTIFDQTSPASCTLPSSTTEMAPPDSLNPTYCSRVSDGQIRVDLFVEPLQQTWLAFGRRQQDGELFVAATVGRAFGRGTVDYLARAGVIGAIKETQRRLLAECVGGMLVRRSHVMADTGKLFVESHTDLPTSAQRLEAFELGFKEGRFKNCLNRLLVK